MSGTNLERARSLHEELELYEQAAVKELDKKPLGVIVICVSMEGH
jgi:hypothetical protein